MCLKPHLSPPTHRSRRFDHLVLESVYTPQLVLMVQVAVSMVQEAVYTPQLVYTPRITFTVPSRSSSLGERLTLCDLRGDALRQRLNRLLETICETPAAGHDLPEPATHPAARKGVSDPWPELSSDQRRCCSSQPMDRATRDHDNSPVHQGGRMTIDGTASVHDHFSIQCQADGWRAVLSWPKSEDAAPCQNDLDSHVFFHVDHKWGLSSTPLCQTLAQIQKAAGFFGISAVGVDISSELVEARQSTSGLLKLCSNFCPSGAADVLSAGDECERHFEQAFCCRPAAEDHGFLERYDTPGAGGCGKL